MTLIRGVSKNLSKNVAQIALMVFALMASMAAQQPDPEVGRAIDAVDASVHADVSEQSQNAPSSRQRMVTSSKWAPSRTVRSCLGRECVSQASSSAPPANRGRQQEGLFEARSTRLVSKIEARQHRLALVAPDSGLPFKRHSPSTAKHRARVSSQKTAESASKRGQSYANAQNSGMVTAMDRRRVRKTDNTKTGIK